MIGFSIASDWFREWLELSELITERSKVKSMQSWITFDTQLKISLMITINDSKMINDNDKYPTYDLR